MKNSLTMTKDFTDVVKYKSTRYILPRLKVTYKVETVVKNQRPKQTNDIGGIIHTSSMSNTKTKYKGITDYYSI